MKTSFPFSDVNLVPGLEPRSIAMVPWEGGVLTMIGVVLTHCWMVENEK